MQSYKASSLQGYNLFITMTKLHLDFVEGNQNNGQVFKCGQTVKGQVTFPKLRNSNEHLTKLSRSLMLHWQKLSQ